jgi:predicted nucleic acid-binding protein
VLAFDAPGWEPPAAVVLDTNVVAEALLPNEKEHRPCVELLERLGVCGTTVVFSRLLKIELWEVAFNLAPRERHPRKKLPHVRFDNRVRPRAARLLGQAQDAWARTLASLSWSVIEIHEVAREVPALMRERGLQSYDAVHAAAVAEFGGTEPKSRAVRDLALRGAEAIRAERADRREARKHLLRIASGEDAGYDFAVSEQLHTSR